MKTKIAVALLTLACVVSIGFPAAAAEDASAARTHSAASATPVQARPATSGQFAILSDVRADALSSEVMESTRGAGAARAGAPFMDIYMDAAGSYRWSG